MAIYRGLSGVDEEVAEQLEESGITKLDELASTDPEQVSEVSQVKLERAERIVQAAEEAVGTLSFESGLKRYENATEEAVISTGYEDLDELLNGGISAEDLTEISGNKGAGRTAIAHLLAVRAQLPPEQGGVEGRVCYLDTRLRFDPTLIQETIRGLPASSRKSLAEQYGVSDADFEATAREVLDRILIARPTTADEQVDQLSHFKTLVDQQEETTETQPIRLLIIDSFDYHLKLTTDDQERHRLTGDNVHAVTDLVEKTEVGIVLMTSLESSKSTWQTMITTASAALLRLTQTSGDVRYAELYEHDHVQGEVPYYISDGHLAAEQ
jgi:RecA/RadA recombinase